jgi:hypothetical protein
MWSFFFVGVASVLSPFSAVRIDENGKPCIYNGKEVPCTTWRAETWKPDRPYCNPVLHEKCNWYNPFSWGCTGGSSCSGKYFSFAGVNLNGQCLCPKGSCVKNGECVPSPEFFKPINKNPKDILCPVLAAMYNAGGFDGMVDELGRVSRLNVQKALVDTIGAEKIVGFFFGIGTAGYRDNDPQSVNQAIMPLMGLHGAVADYLSNATVEANAENTRYLNIFQMSGNPEVLHNKAAGLRNPTTKETDPEDRCKGESPCRAKFEVFISRFADANGRIYPKNMAELARNILQDGEYGGVGLPGTALGNREWDALAGWMAAFGKKDENEQIYLPLEWARTMVMDGVFPKNWVKRTWGVSDVAEIERVGGFETNFGSMYNSIACAIGIKDCSPAEGLAAASDRFVMYASEVARD